MDFVVPIVKKGGWLTFVWDLNKGCQEIKDFEDVRGSDEIDVNANWAYGVASIIRVSLTNPSPVRNHLQQTSSMELGFSAIDGGKKINKDQNELYLDTRVKDF